MPNINNVIDDVKQTMFPNGGIEFEVQQRSSTRWIVYIHIPYTQHSGKAEFIIEENSNNPEDSSVLAAVLRHGCVSRRTMSLIMDAITERL